MSPTAGLGLSAFTSSSSLASGCCIKRALFNEFHSSATSHHGLKSTSSRGKRNGPTVRTGLAKTLKPRSKATPFEYASVPRRPRLSKPAASAHKGVAAPDLHPRLRLEPPSDSSSANTSRAAKIYNPLGDEFALTTQAESVDALPQRFTSPPLNEGLLTCVHEILGPNARPTPIQALALKHLLPPAEESAPTPTWNEYLLASETGSGKSLAYLLPMLHALKASEGAPVRRSKYATAPRALVLAPTHELARQLATSAKSLLHVAKLRVLCASRANVPSASKSPARPLSASKMARAGGAFFRPPSSGEEGGDVGEIDIRPGMGGTPRPIDVLVGTPMKILEMAKGHGWDRGLDVRRAGDPKREVPPGWVVRRPEMGLENVEWVVIDEADVLFDSDFQKATRLLLADISGARGHPVPLSPDFIPKSDPRQPTTSTSITYPFNLVLTTATVPSSLGTYLDTHHSRMTRLISPALHKLPSKLAVEHAAWTGGNRNADVEQRIRSVWRDDAVAGFDRSKVLVFFNKGTKVEECAAFLNEKGVPTVALTGTSAARSQGSNRHIASFLRPRQTSYVAPSLSDAPPLSNPPAADAATKAIVPSISTSPSTDEPRVLITTSLLSRGLDFDPSVRHVFIADPPRNMIDFLHRAGRAGRAGMPGKVVIFGKAKGRGSSRTREVKQKVGAVMGRKRRV
ncbi:P-loop containing nucleoside triphosphate hydrolase protein [Punctularia strigosozonata HHB-11173 SS5]|uniref:P-loop containing nucleoside triphosphate hydrolase protein n=1 Tax=Punctularia strigosozonata (strain HHB-11173) TaxID=741275 RepID=UPI0004416F1B|nr:P-loop containing nucleoside triphosphate hydrolase protein [Punctularia strigosozonata HHB-11173 SS5]EIN06616.1 P-loop containing nucleoside triphosphate hydrolase protein [Punctularia strigosozonata HHB-11173 SS5]